MSTKIVKYSKVDKSNKNFMYNDFRRANFYNCKFINSNFDFASFRGAHLKACDFYEASFMWTEFVGTNLKKSKFKKAIFKNVVFEGVNLDGADFLGAKFEECIFVDCNLDLAENISSKTKGIKIYETMPEIVLSRELEEAINEAMENKFIKKSRVLDTKEGVINPLSVERLLTMFKEKYLIKGLGVASKNIEKDFCTLSYIITAIKSYERQGLI